MARMQFWKIGLLKERLARNEVTEGETFAYFLAAGVLEVVGAVLALTTENNMWDTVDTVDHCILFTVGTVACFVANGGRSGQRFLERYFALGWVLGIRLVVFVIPLFLLATIGSCLVTRTEPGESTLVTSVVFAAVEVAYYMLLALAIHQVSETSRAPRSSPDAGARGSFE